MTDGTRTRDTQDHNLVLYQLNYSHHYRIEKAVSQLISAANYMVAHTWLETKTAGQSG